MGAPEVEAFAGQGGPASTQNQALSAIRDPLPVLKKVLRLTQGCNARAKKPARLPVVFTGEEARARLARLDGTKSRGDPQGANAYPVRVRSNTR